MSDREPIRTRAPAIDLARGWALLGVGVVNVHVFANGFAVGNHGWDKATTALDQFAEIIVGTVFAHRAFPTLAFLFGLGLALLAARGGTSARLWVLLGVGAALGLTVWPGEILTPYALIGLLAAFRVAKSDYTRATKWVGILGVLNMLLFGTLGLYFMSEGVDDKCAQNLDMSSSFALYSWRAGLGMRATEWVTNGLGSHLLLPTVWLCIFFGVMAAKSEKFWRTINDPVELPRWIPACFAIFLIATCAELFAGIRGGWHAVPCSGLWFGIYSLGLELSAITSIPVIIVSSIYAYRRFPNAWVIHVLRAVGRAPLSMFIGQAIIFMFLFHQAWGGLNGRLVRSGTFAIAIGTYFVLAMFLLHWQRNGRSSGPVDAFVRSIEQRMTVDRRP